MTHDARRHSPGTRRVILSAPALAFAVAMLWAEPVLAQPAPAASTPFQAKVEQAARTLATEKRLKKLSPQQRQAVVEFVVGSMLFVAAHELGHGAMFEFELPNLGRDEDAADAFAILTAVRIGTEFSHRVLIESAKGYYLNARRDQKEGEKLAFYDEHGLNLQRAYQIVCYLFGSDPQQYKALALEAKLPEDRQETCKADYKATLWSWETLLKPHLRKPDQPKQAIELIYGEATDSLKIFAETFRNIGFLETLVEHVADRYAWPKPLVMEMQTCGDANARWQARRLTLCYELVQEFANLYRDFGQDSKDAKSQRKR